MIKLRVLSLTMFATGLLASIALAGPPAGVGKNATSNSASTESTTASSDHQRVTLCQPTGSKSHPYAKITVAAASVKAHTKKGDVRPDANGDCPAAAPAPPTTTSSGD